MAYDSAAYAGGFSNPVYEAQATFKALMDGFARPGTIGSIGASALPPAPMSAASGAIALALCDHDTPVCLSPGMIASGVQGWLAFQTGALVAGERSEAEFAFYEKGATLPALSTFSAGSQDYPDRSATVVVELPSLAGGPALSISGPGVDGRRLIAPLGLAPHFEKMWHDNHGLYPRGVDLVLVAGSQILCLPRTIVIHKEA